MPTAIDLFAGAGGFTTGAIQAGLSVVWAANHWPIAVETHRVNHPATVHDCQDLHQVDWTTVPAHDILLASPACQGHSRARGKERPHHDAMRSTAWAVTSALEVHRPEGFVVENVPEFMNWVLFPTWWDSLKRLGYKPLVQVLNAADFGVPQSRERIIITGTLRRVVPIRNPKLAHVPARTVIDWSSGNWTDVYAPGRAARTLKQFENGHRIYGNRFLIAYYGAEKNGRSLDKPIGTLTTNDRYAVVNGDKFRMLTEQEVKRFMGFPETYVLLGNHKERMKQMGNAIPPPLAAGVISQLLNSLS